MFNFSLILLTIFGSEKCTSGCTRGRATRPVVDFFCTKVAQIRTEMNTLPVYNPLNDLPVAVTFNDFREVSEDDVFKII